MTRDVGKGGAFIETANMPPIGAQVSVVVTLRGRVSEDMEAHLCGVGCVLHVLRAEGVVVGFGARVLFRTEATSSSGIGIAWQKVALGPKVTTELHGGCDRHSPQSGARINWLCQEREEVI